MFCHHGTHLSSSDGGGADSLVEFLHLGRRPSNEGRASVGDGLAAATAVAGVTAHSHAANNTHLMTPHMINSLAPGRFQ